MNDEATIPDDAAEPRAHSYWWCAGFGDTLIWSRLDVREDGIAEVLGATGEYLRYDDETAARMALLDADFREFDGLDEEDALVRGFSLHEVQPPQADSDEGLRGRMIQSRGGRA